MNPIYFIAPAGAIAALITAFLFSRSVMARSEGDAEMVRIAQAVREGAMAYLKRQYKVVFGVFVGLLIFLGILAAMGIQETLTLAGVPIAGFFSGLCGWFGMKMATNASARTAAAARDSLNEGLTVAFRSGAVMGMIVVGFALLDASAWFFVLNTFTDMTVPVLTTIMLSYGMGASTQALFARVGGGIYTKAADVGADLVGKVEAGIPEDDARNPATIADNVGDNVGDVAGMGADLYESYYGSILATMALGAAAAFTLPGVTTDQSGALAMLLALAPLALAGAGIFCSILGVFTVKAKEGASFAELLKGLHKGVYVASGLIIICAFALLFVLLNSGDGKAVAQAAGVSWLGIGGSIASGLIAGLVIAYATEYYTSYEHPPTQRISHQAITGPATVIISGIAEGMKSTWASLVTVVIAIIAAFAFAGGGDNFLMGLYGVGIAAVGMLATLGITLATDAYGPIADNAGGNAEMTGQPPHVRERTDMLDSLGNTTAATGKGFAIGSAALTALALFAAYLQVVQTQLNTQAVDYVTHANIQAPAGEYAVHQGFGKFGVVFTGATEADTTTFGAILEDKTQFEGAKTSWRDIPVGETFTVIHGSADDHNITIAGHDLRFDIVSLSHGRIADVLAFYDMTLTNPRVLGGVFIGVMLAFVFCAMTMNAVGRAANLMMVECRRQFGKMREGFLKSGMSKEDVADPMKWPKQVEYEGVHYPDYASCVSISTAGAQKEMVVPAMMAIIIPIAVGLILSVPGVVGMLAGGLTSGFAVAIFMANAGGAWDNAKKLIESYGRISANDFANNPDKRECVPHQIRDDIDLRAQAFIADGRGDAIVYGKGSDDHKATVVGDTVGDPFKDTSGPSLNILIKLISIVSVVFAGLIVKFGPYIGDILGIN
ncbi:MAG: sodium/proton-translocating pyrophosphatase [Phycisphaeraceae bacterium]|nr:sodium/proton-translocating pyrophosphatase [Phycisphaeraceae bacterium]MCB9848112.1 sodium/proton-translocating pyrophosphatase [Phycisphaeraceae bacterium]